MPETLPANAPTKNPLVVIFPLALNSPVTATRLADIVVTILPLVVNNILPCGVTVTDALPELFVNADIVVA